jgi:hypothetical protein
MKRILPLCVLLVALGYLPVSAILDTNGNGFSDLWEMTYNDGNLYSTSLDPLDDPDFDGWTNEQEAAAGTNPLDPNPPDGFLRPEIVHIPAVAGDPGTPEVVTVSWPTIPGKQYTLLFSPDLSEWLPVPGETFIGSGLIVTDSFLVTDSDTRFWRVGVTDTDTDGDGLTNAEEFVLGTDPNNPDTDGDGLTDIDEIAAGTNPNTFDTDGDRVSDGKEVSTGHDALSNQSFPPRWLSTQRYLFHGILSVESTNEWNTESVLRSLQIHAVAPEDLGDWLAADCTFPENPPSQQPFQMNLRPSFGDNLTTSASLTQTRFWLETKPAPLEEVRINLLRVTRRNLTGSNPTPQPTVVESIEVVIPVGETISLPIDALPIFTAEQESVEVDLVAIEFKIYPDTTAGPDKAHKLNLDSRQNEKAFYGAGWEKCVAKVWEPQIGVDSLGGPLDPVHLIDYLEGGAGNHGVYDNLVKWKVNGIEQTTHRLHLGNEPSDDAHRHFYVEVLARSGGPTIDRLIISVIPRTTKTKFDTWYAAERADLTWLAELPNLFTSISTTPVGGYLPRPDRNFNPFLYGVPHEINTRMHPNTYFEARSYATAGGHGHQMCFTELGNLLQAGAGVSAGSADKAAPFPANLNANLHIQADVKPFIWALQLDGSPADQDVTTLTAPIMHEGAYLKRYSECRPPVANSKPILSDGATP